MEADAPEPVKKRSETRATITPECNAIVCYLRLNPKVAKTYGMTKLDRNTSVGSMLMQTLQAQGMAVNWYDRLPNGALDEGKTANDKAAAYIKRIHTRPGARMKRLDERPEVAPPDTAAIVRHHGVLPRVSFPLLLKLAKYRRAKKTTACGNKVGRTRLPTCPHLTHHPCTRAGRCPQARGARRARLHHAVRRAAPALRVRQAPALLKGGLAAGASLAQL